MTVVGWIDIFSRQEGNAFGFIPPTNYMDLESNIPEIVRVSPLLNFNS
ncbi:hypothetical protein G3O08_17660 [Cryomorpha ignava]|uniref:Uncharacterized protein n=1 Tax=Cryomorpha ignava TaxID=101383 RepID=A0A7K3WUH8_9FLAO|nr:hypothetical protein [Cryomorpha ignava]NEN25327.1 hypothetical protein [Cryomorpha ignava]